MARQKSTIKKQVIKHMQDLGTYRLEYRTTIDVFVDMLHQYEVFVEKFEESNYRIEEEYTNKAGATNMRKTPLFSALEKLRVDIATYSNILCLNPKALDKVATETQTKSKLASVLEALD